MADLGDLILRLKVDSSEYERDLRRARALAAGLNDINIRLDAAAIGNASRQLGQFRSATTAATGGFSVLQGVIQGASQAITQSLIQVGAGLADIPRRIASISLGNFQQFDAQLQQFSALTGKSREEISPLTDEIKRLAIETTKAPGEIAAAANEMVTLGSSADEVQDQLAGVVALSEATSTGLSQAASVSQLASNTFGFSAQETADKLSVLRNTTAADVGDVQQLIQQAAGIFGSLGEGADPDELLAFFATLRDGGLNAEVAATGLRGAIATLVDPNKADELEKLGVTAFDAEGNFLGFESVLRQLQKTQGQFTPGDFTGLLVETFGREVVPTITTGLKLLDSNFTQTANNIRNAAGTAAESAGVLVQGFSGSIDLLQGSIEGLSIEFGGALAPLAQAGVEFASAIANALLSSEAPFEALTAATNRVLDLFRSSPETIDLLSKAVADTIGSLITNLAAGITALTDQIAQDPQAFINAILTTVQQVGFAITTISQAIGQLFLFVINNSELIGRILQGIGLLIAGLAASSVIGGIVSLFTAVGSAITAVGSAVTFLGGIFGAVIPAITSTIGGLLLAFQAGGLPALIGAIGAAVGGLAAAAAPVVAVIAAIAGAIAGVVLIFRALQSEEGQRFFSELSDAAGELFDRMRESEVFQAFIRVLGSATEFAVALAGAIGRIVAAAAAFTFDAFTVFLDQVQSAGSDTRNLVSLLGQFAPPLQLAAGLAQQLGNILLFVLNQTGNILENLTAALNGPQTQQGFGDNLAAGLSTAADAMGQLAENSQGVSDVDQAAAELAALGDAQVSVETNAAEPETGELRNLQEEEAKRERELEALRLKNEEEIAAAKEKQDIEALNRERAFDEESLARERAFEDEAEARKLQTEERVAALKKQTEAEIEAQQLANEQELDAIRKASQADLQQQQEAFEQRQREEERRFQEELQARREQGQREFGALDSEVDRRLQLETAETPEERQRLEEQFARQREEAALRREIEEDVLRQRGSVLRQADQDGALELSPLEQARADFEASLREEERLFAEQQRVEEQAFQQDLAAQREQIELGIAELQRQREEELTALREQSELQIAEVQRQADEEERQRQRAFEDEQRRIEAAFNDEERRKDFENARAIERLKAGQASAATVTARRHGGAVLPGQTYLAGEAGPELLRMGGLEALITKPSLMQFDQPGRIYSAPQTRRKLSGKTLAGGGTARLEKQMDELILLVEQGRTQRGGDQVNYFSLSGQSEAARLAATLRQAQRSNARGLV